MSKNRTRPLPDFLGIGTQRSGTTWLYRHLGLHPEIWMPPIKEIHFFDRAGGTVFTNKKEKLIRDLKKRFAAYKSPSKVPQHQSPNLRWDIAYFSRYHSTDLKWYTSLFLPGADKITGEITPEYMALDRKMVEKIYAHNPTLKIIFFMRDPIERVWSAAIKRLAKIPRRDASEISDELFINYVQQPGTSVRSNYLRALSNWESFFPAEQVYIDFFDNIQQDPQVVLLRIFKFLRVEASPALIKRKPHKKIASTERFKIPIPPAVAAEIAAANMEQLEKLSQRFGGYPAQWLQRSKDILENYEQHASDDIS